MTFNATVHESQMRTWLATQWQFTNPNMDGIPSLTLRATNLNLLVMTCGKREEISPGYATIDKNEGNWLTLDPFRPNLPSFLPSRIFDPTNPLTTALKYFQSAVVAGKQCIVVETNSKMAEISETLCIGCGICVKVISFTFFIEVYYLSGFRTALSASGSGEGGGGEGGWRRKR